jgi:subtilisin family serine protease
MKIRLSIFLLTCIQLFALTRSQAQSEIAPELFDRMQTEPDDYLPAYLLLSDRVDVEQLYHDWAAIGLSQQERVAILLPRLQAKAKNTQAPLLAYLRNHPQVRPNSLASTWVVNMIFLEAQPDLLRELAQRSDIEFIGEDHLLEPAVTETVDEAPLPPFDQTRERSLESIRATDMWRLGYTGYGRKALVIDTGNELDHPALRAQYLGQWSSTTEAWNGTGDPVPCTEDEGGLSDHGTHVTGTVCGLDRLTEDTIGVAFDAQWMGGGVFLLGCDNFNSGGVRSIFQTFEWSLNPDGNPSTVDDMPDVINNSWGSLPSSDCSSSPYIDLIYTLNAAGIAAVWSAGNRGPDPSSISTPAGLALDLVTIFSVANINAQNTQWPINNGSSRGPSLCTVSDSSLLIKPEVGAPGTLIRSAVPGGGYRQFSGTSMAAPHVAGAVLLLKEAFPDLMGVEVLEALYFTCTDLGEPGEDNVYGQGMINVRAAYDYLVDAGHTPAPPAARTHEVIALDLQSQTINCAEAFNFRFYLENGSPDTLRQVDIHYELDEPGLATGSFTWEGTLAPGQRQWFTSPPVPAATGSYRLTVRAALPNGVPDARFLNNQLRTDILIIDEAPTDILVSNTNSCTGARAVLRAMPTAPTDEIVWYTNSPDNILGTGSTFLTPPLTEATTFTADIVRRQQTGLPLTPTTTTSLDDRPGGLVFDVHYPITLYSFKVKAEERGGRMIRLLSEEGLVLKSRIVSIPGPGEYVVDFGINIPIGNNYVLEQTAGRGLYLQAGSTTYPIRLGPVLSITGVSGSGINRRSYPYFYDWDVGYTDYCGAASIELVPSQGGGTLPEAFFETANRELTLGTDDLARFENLSSNATSYRWDFGDGESSMDASPEHRYTTPGTYFVSLVATNSEGCESAWLDTIQVREQAVSSDELSPGANQLSLFPNPTTGEVFLELPATTPSGGQLQVLDLNGRRLLQQVWRESLQKLDISTLPAGLYILRYEQEGQVLIGKVIKE